MAVAGEPYSHPEDLFPLAEVGLCRLQLLLGGPLLRSDSVLVGLEELERDGVRVVGVEELLSLVGELGQAPGEDDASLGGLCLPLHDLLFQLLGEPLNP
ncbi:MAG: hypothetical protein ACRDIX_02515 [Actinomycetota bacterium]